MGGTHVSTTSYEEAVATHEWHVPERYNIAQDVCDKHPRDKLAMIHEHFDGTVRSVQWGELQELSNRFANVLRGLGVEKGDRVAMLLPPTPGDRGRVLRHLEVRRDPALDVGPVRRRRHPPPRVRLPGQGARHQRGQPRPGRSVAGRARAGARRRAVFADASPDFTPEDTLADDPAQLYYTCGTTGLAKGIIHAHRYLLAHEEFIYCHDVQDGESFHGMGEWAWAAGIAPLLGPWRFGAVQLVYQREGGFDPHKQLAFLSRHEASNVFTTPTAMRSMMGIADAGTRYPQKFRIVCSAGEPLNPEAIRWFREQYGLTVLDYYGLTESYPLVRELPVHGGPRGLDGQADARLGRPDPRRGRAAGAAGRERRDLPARALEPHYPLGYWRNEEAARGDLRRRLVPHQGRRAFDEDGYVWYEGRADDVIISAGYRIGPFEVESACLEHAAVKEAAAVAVARRASRRRSSRRSWCSPSGIEGSDELVEEIQAHVRDRLSAYAYPREIEFVEDLPKTLTGKIRRVELRQRELEARG